MPAAQPREPTRALDGDHPLPELAAGILFFPLRQGLLARLPTPHADLPCMQDLVLRAPQQALLLRPCQGIRLQRRRLLVADSDSEENCLWLKDSAPDVPVQRPPGLIEILLPENVTLRVDSRVDGQALRRVLAALAAR